MAAKLITAPAKEPITLTDLETHLRADLSNETATVAVMISSARDRAETITRRALITQTWELVLDLFPQSSGAIGLPFPPLQSVTSIKYIDPDGVEQTLNAADYIVDKDSEPARIVPAYGKTWPSTRYQINAVRVRFVCGYGDTATDVPMPIKQWMLLQIGSMYENREAINIGNTVNPIPFVDGLLDSFRAVTF